MSDTTQQKFQDIGVDPLSLANTGDLVEEAKQRLNKGVAVQQEFVPDQTMLAWRIDVSRILSETIILKAQRDGARRELETAKARIEKLARYLEKFNEHNFK